MSVAGDTLRPRLSLLVDSGADRFDPVGFAFIESMARRAESLRGMVRGVVERRALEALAEYQSRFDRARADASSTLASLLDKFPEHGEQGREFFEKSQFKELERLYARLERSARRPSLRELRAAVGRFVVEEVATGQQMSFDALLAQHEADVVEECGEALGPRPKVDDSHELKSFKLFKDTWARLHSERVVTQAIKNRPENPGPLNPQMLAIKSLSTMRELSPDYLNRFVSYVDTLLWLEKSEAMLVPAKAAEKTKGRKASKKVAASRGKKKTTRGRA